MILLYISLNRLSFYLQGLIKSCDNESFTMDTNIRLAAFFDDEEVGHICFERMGAVSV